MIIQEIGKLECTDGKERGMLVEATNEEMRILASIAFEEVEVRKSGTNGVILTIKEVKKEGAA